MKKYIILILSGIMLIMTSGIAMAGTITFDYLPHGDITGDLDLLSIVNYNHTFNDSLTLSALSVTIPAENVNLTFDYSNGTFMDHANISSYKLKGGLTLIKDRSLRADINCGYLATNLSPSATDKLSLMISSIVVGGEARLFLSKSLWIGAGVDYGVKPKATIKYLDDLNTDMNSILTLNMKLNYTLTRDLGLALGYRQESFKVTDSASVTSSGYSIGIVYKF